MQYKEEKWVLTYNSLPERTTLTGESPASLYPIGLAASPNCPIQIMISYVCFAGVCAVIGSVSANRSITTFAWMSTAFNAPASGSESGLPDAPGMSDTGASDQTTAICRLVRLEKTRGRRPELYWTLGNAWTTGGFDVHSQRAEKLLEDWEGFSETLLSIRYYSTV